MVRNSQMAMQASAAVAACRHTTEKNSATAIHMLMYRTIIRKKRRSLAVCSAVGTSPVQMRPKAVINPPMEKTVMKIAAAPARNLALMMVSR